MERWLKANGSSMFTNTNVNIVEKRLFQNIHSVIVATRNMAKYKWWKKSRTLILSQLKILWHNYKNNKNKRLRKYYMQEIIRLQKLLNRNSRENSIPFSGLQKKFNKYLFGKPLPEP